MTGTLILSAKASPFPLAAIAIAAFTGKAQIIYNESANLGLDLDGSQVTQEHAIIHALAKAGGLSEDSTKTPSFFALAESLSKLSTFKDVVSALDSLDDYLAFRTFLVGHEITAADWVVWGALKGSVKVVGLLKNIQYQHLLRWCNHLESLESTQTALANLASAKANNARSNKTAAGFALGLQDAKMGEVVTRFPPEPSGYLHIGHTKAVLLNQYFARMYQGRLIVRFDDTNPTKERAEFEDAILKDLTLLNVTPDHLSHTSDHFDRLCEYAIQLIKSGKAYADNTEQGQMRQERMDGIASKHRDDSIEDNLHHFEEMKAATPDGLRWCLRAKISVNDNNKALRDPVIYRCNLVPHHRTGDKWKIYPTYDFVCPVVDSLEGVTHALRTNEYRDRNPQYKWIIESLGLRPVHIWDFSRLNFIYTLLSKRKLHWFVDNGYVRGWDDPRFPTVRGIRRRGLTVEALSQFMLLQGPSQAILSLEWDSLWALNKKVIDPVAPRFWAIVRDNHVVVTLNGGPTSLEVKTLPRHKKNPEVGEKQTVYASTIILEQQDAASFDEQEEITLMDWGNAIVRSKITGPDGQISALTMDLNLDGDFRKTKKKITWLAKPTAAHVLIPITLLDYDYIITKEKLGENDNVEDFVTPVTEFREEALGDVNLNGLVKGDIIQFERKGFYILDGRVRSGAAERLEFIKIPDGRAASVASKAGVQPPSVPTAKATNDIVTATKMYHVEKVYNDVSPVADTKMYAVKSVYDVV